MRRLVVSEEFSPNPDGRFRSDGPFSGQEFREDHLIPSLSDFDTLVVVLDGARGYPSSFLDEAFAGLIREFSWSKADFDRRIEIQASGPYKIYADDIDQYVDEEVKRAMR